MIRCGLWRLQPLGRYTPGMTPSTILFLSLAPAFAAGQHSLEVRVKGSEDTFVHSLRIGEASQANFTGGVRGRGGSTRQMIFNALLAKAPSGEFDVQHQIELSGGRGGAGPILQVQGEVGLSAGAPLTVVECGKWTVSLTVNPGGAKARGRPRDNYRVNAELNAAGARLRCRQVLRNATQGSVADGLVQTGRRFGLVLNSLPSVSATGAASLQYQLAYTPLSAPAGSLQLQNESQLKLGKREVVSKGADHALSLTLERVP